MDEQVAAEGTVAVEREPSVSRYRWVMLGLLCLGYGSFGLVQASLAPLITPILAATDMTRAQMGVVLASWQFVYLFVAIPAGMVIDRFGMRRTFFAGIAFVALSEVCRAAAVNQATMLLAVMIFGLGGPFISIGAPKLTATWFPEHEVGLALGIYTVSQSVGSMIVTATANSVVMPATGESWRLTLVVFSGVTVFGALAWLVLARDPRARPGAPGQSLIESSLLASFGALLRLRVVRLVLVMATGVFLFNHSFTNWLPEMLRSRGMSASDAGFWAAFPTLVAIGAALVIPRFTTRRWLTAVQVAVFVLGAVAATLLHGASGGGAYPGLLLVGVVRGAATPLLMLTLLRSPQVGAGLMGAAGGLFFTAGEIGGVAGPSLTGVLADATGGFAAGLLLLAAVAALLALLALALASAGRAPAPAAVE